MTSVPTGAEDRALAALQAFGREPGRSAAIRVVLPGVDWSAGLDGDVARPAASLLKLPLAMAAEEAAAADDSLMLRQASVAELLAHWHEPSVLRALDPDHRLNLREAIRLTVSSSDGAAASWLLALFGLARVDQAVAVSGCEATSLMLSPGSPGGALIGQTTAADALRLLGAAVDESRHPIVAGALKASTLNSRIPLGVRRSDIDVAHKTGTLRSVAHDVALLDVPGGQVWLAFLSDAQHDTLVTGYEMGLCTQQVLGAFDLQVTSSRSAVGTEGCRDGRG